MFKNTLKTTLRNIQRYKMYSVINTAGLAIGMACFILIFMWVLDEISYDRFHENSDDLYRVIVHYNDRPSPFCPWALVPTLKQDVPEIAAASWYLPYSVLTAYEEDRYYEDYAFVSPDFFTMFTFPFLRGDPESACSGTDWVIMTEGTALKYFGSADPMGRVILLHNALELTVTGVIADMPSNSHMQFDLAAHPESIAGEERLRTWSADGFSYAMLQGGVDAEAVVQKISGTIMKYDQRTQTRKIVDLQSFKKVHLYALSGTDPVVYVYIFSSIAVIVLLIACINFMNLATARSATRAREVGMRKVVGASRSDLIRQFFGESILLTFLALIGAIIIVYLFLPKFNTIASKQLSLNLINNPFWWFMLPVIALITGLIAGSYPSLFLSSFHPASIVKGGTLKGSKGRLLRRGLIVFQFTAAVILICSTSIITMQIRYIQNRDLGFDREQILCVRMNRDVHRNYDSIKLKLLENENILNATGASSIPLHIGNNNPVYWEGGGPDQYMHMNFACVDYDYFETLGMEMVHGRTFQREFPTDQENYIINEAALELTGYENPIGRMFSMWTDEGQIVGVVKNFHGTSLHNNIRPIVFMLYQNLPYHYYFIKIRPENTTRTIQFIRETMESMVPGFLFRYFFLDDRFREQYRGEDRIGNILETFSFLAIFISCLGILGLASFMAERRSREIAVRKILGASSGSIVASLSKEFLILVAIANLIAWPVAFFTMNAWIRNYAYHTRIGWAVFVLAGLTALAIALFTVSFQALKAARANPVESLRYE